MAEPTGRVNGNHERIGEDEVGEPGVLFRTAYRLRAPRRSDAASVPRKQITVKSASNLRSSGVRHGFTSRYFHAVQAAAPNNVTATILDNPIG